ncbi:MAG: Ca2+-dependent phosphoinositide-specific phospholipase C [Tepidisphaerales bacterium]
MALLTAATAGALPAGAFASPDRALHPLPFNRVQLIGSHNSYKQAFDSALPELAKEMGRDVSGIDYAHPPLIDQLKLGLRQLELDLYHDPTGGRYAHPLLLKLLAQRQLPARPFDPDGELRQPGLKVLHSHDLDFRTHHYTFASALRALRAFSELHPEHIPVVILLDLKYARNHLPGETEPLMFDESALAGIEATILEELGPGRVVRPDDLRRDAPDLRTAVTNLPWPTAGEWAGRFIFIMQEHAPLTGTYSRMRPGLRGAVIFPDMPPDHPDAAFLILNDPVSGEEAIRRRVQEGFFVRTRSDASTREMRGHDFRRFEAAQRSGAQAISTDYYLADWRINPDFVIRFAPGTYARPNPLFVPSAGERRSPDDAR